MTEQNNELKTNRIINGNCIDVMKTFPESSIDLIVTSPPYNCSIDYDVYKDDLPMEDYWEWTKQWLTEAYRVLKVGGRISVNIPYEVNVQERGGRVLFMAEFYSILKSVGFKFFGLVDLDEQSPHRSKTTAWGSWMSPSSPYIYNPKECIILSYKENSKKQQKGEPQWMGQILEVEQEDGSIKKKMIYTEEDKKEFMSLVYGQWEYFADTKQMTKATFSMDIPTKAIKILTYKNDVVLDPFTGSGTSMVAAEILDRRWLGIELSPTYAEVARKRVESFVEKRKQLSIEGL
jgi:site-specific DNA-methyltransferase (adenine-specific)